MRAHEISKSAWLKKKANRLGRGNASKGNTSGRWHKWQKARSGFSAKATFEWGQTPLVQRMPKARWFKRYYKLVDNYVVINVADLNKNENVSDWLELSKFKLKELWYIKKESDLVKILWNGELSKKIKFVWIEKFSKSAQEKIEKAGGNIE